MSLIDILYLHHPNDREKSSVRALGGSELNELFQELLSNLSVHLGQSKKHIAKNVFKVNPNSLQNWCGANPCYPNGHPIPLWAISLCLQLLKKRRSRTHMQIIKNIEQLQCGRVARTVNAVTKLDPLLARLCGAHAAAGSLYLQSGRGPITALWEIGDQEKSNIEAVQEWSRRLFGIELRLQRKGAMYYIRSDTQVIPRYLIQVFDFPLGEKSRTVREPNILANTNDERALTDVREKERWQLRLDFAKEVVNFDGHSTITGGIVSVGLGSDSADLRMNLCEIFDHFGVKFRNYDAHKKMLTTSSEESRKLYELGLFRGQKRMKLRNSLCH